MRHIHMRACVRASQAILLLCLVLFSAACQDTSPTAQADGTCTYSNKPLECTFSITYPSNATGSFQYEIAISDTAHTKIVPLLTSGTLLPGFSQKFAVTYFSCPAVFIVKDAGQKDHPVLKDLTQKCTKVTSS